MSDLAPLSELHVTVPRTARYYLLGAPGAQVRDVWIACHGYAQLAADFAKPWRSLVDDTRLIVVPEALSRFYTKGDTGMHGADSLIGASWMTREDREAEIADIVTYLDQLVERILELLAPYDVARDALRIHALGFSQGAATICRWAARGSVRVDHLIVWGSGVPTDVNLRAVAERAPDFRLDAVYGRRDAYVTQEGIEALRTRLDGEGVAYELRSFDGGHVLSRATLRTLMERHGAG